MQFTSYFIYLENMQLYNMEWTIILKDYLFFKASKKKKNVFSTKKKILSTITKEKD